MTITGDANGDDVTLAGGITDVDASWRRDRLDDNSRIFDATAALTLDGLTLTGGRTTADLGRRRGARHRPSDADRQHGQRQQHRGADARRRDSGASSP